MNQLIALSYSPWSEKARWALDHHGIDYGETAYVPMLGEPLLRLATRRISGRVTVPALIAGRRVYGDSLDIARFAEESGHGSRLLPEPHLGEILDWNEKSEMAAESGRGLVINRVLQDQDAQVEALPPVIPEMLRSSLRPLARSGVEFLSRKYRLTDDSLMIHQKRLREQLNALRAALAKSSPYLTGRFSYADIAMAVTLQFVVPVAEKYIPLGPATRQAMTDPVLKDEFTDLVQWRDLVYGKHRRR